MQTIKFQRPKPPQTDPPKYADPLFINFRGTVFARCQRCRTLRRHTQLEVVKVIVAHGIKWTDGVNVPKRGGRITYSARKRIFYPIIRKLWFCERCR